MRLCFFFFTCYHHTFGVIYDMNTFERLGQSFTFSLLLRKKYRTPIGRHLRFSSFWCVGPSALRDPMQDTLLHTPPFSSPSAPFHLFTIWEIKTPCGPTPSFPLFPSFSLETGPSEVSVPHDTLAFFSFPPFPLNSFEVWTGMDVVVIKFSPPFFSPLSFDEPLRLLLCEFRCTFPLPLLLPLIPSPYLMKSPCSFVIDWCFIPPLPLLFVRGDLCRKIIPDPYASAPLFFFFSSLEVNSLSSFK